MTRAFPDRVGGKGHKFPDERFKSVQKASKETGYKNNVHHDWHYPSLLLQAFSVQPASLQKNTA